MVPISQIKVGDLVRIVDKWDGEYEPARDDPINKWLGQVMTVSFVSRYDMRMAETGKDVCWFPEDMAEVLVKASEDDFDFDFSCEDFEDFLTA